MYAYASIEESWASAEAPNLRCAYLAVLSRIPPNAERKESQTRSAAVWGGKPRSAEISCGKLVFSPLPGRSAARSASLPGETQRSSNRPPLHRELALRALCPGGFHKATGEVAGLGMWFEVCSIGRLHRHLRQPFWPG